ncbi:cortical protein KAR9-domain-containing protein [Triangularia setosa]|uniref:Cortical protein KAR9-domain-containing protein n=1 Tax=Triangularia setosa TaxID=2587417 RepID=A0AAN6W8N5_9PEZI|nr:cortical protein KAR9-domain-containing protein [Podospora setosa]
MSALVTAAAAPGSSHHELTAPIITATDVSERDNGHETRSISTDLLPLRVFGADQHHTSNSNSTSTGTGTTSDRHNGDSPNITTNTNPQQQQKQAQSQQLSADDPAGPRATTPGPSSVHRARKPSPGLAARLKALGFGSSRKTTSPPPSSQQDIGRLPEEQLRKLDQGHQANSAAAVIERRGRPWKGPIIRIPSRSSLKSDKSHGKPALESPAFPSPSIDTKPELLPEITTTEPLEMDTNKYRLPDHTNGNGVKAQLDTREEHIARDTRPPPPPQTPEIPPLPLPKDTPPTTSRAFNPTTPASGDVFNPNSLTFNPLGLQRPGSIYTLSRASFANQLAQLTSLQLPDAESLSSKVSAIPTAQVATKALIGAAEQIRGWIYKASEVIGGLESEDDVEWAAAGGREGVEEVENAIIRFEELIKVYVGAIEELQAREDIATVSADDLRRAVAQMEAILDEWAKMRNTLHNVKAQVEIAMEWEELWNMVLGDIENELNDLSRLVFEMEERRHKSVFGAPAGEGCDIGELDPIAEDTPPPGLRLPGQNNRFSLPPFPLSPGSPSPGAMGISQDDSSLLALFARMQPLRASLDFLPMRLSVFEARAEDTFPTACEELEMRRADLDASYKKLEKDAESLRKELGEDRWILVFRNAGRQAQKMYESVERSTTWLREAIESGLHLTSPPAMSKKIENYEARKTHYGEAIERLLTIIDKGVKDRFTINGEISRLHTEMRAKWEDLKRRIVDLDVVLEEIQQERKSQQLRDSVSSILSNGRSTIQSTHETPESSPPSSVIMSSHGPGSSSTNIRITKSRSASGGSQLPQPSSRRMSSLPTTSHSSITRKPVAARMSTLSVPSREGSATPTGNRPSRPPSSLANRPKWNASTNTSDVDTGHNFKPLTLTTPSPYAKKTPTPARSVSALTPSSSASKLPTLRSPLGRASSVSPVPDDNMTPNKSHSRLSFRERLASTPGLYAQRPRLASASTMAGLSANNRDRRASMQPVRPLEQSPDATTTTPRPASSMAGMMMHSGRRSSLLPQPQSSFSRSTSGLPVTGRASPQAIEGARVAMGLGRNKSAMGQNRGVGGGEQERRGDARPRWRG